MTSLLHWPWITIFRGIPIYLIKSPWCIQHSIITSAVRPVFIIEKWTKWQTCCSFWLHVISSISRNTIIVGLFSSTITTLITTTFNRIFCGGLRKTCNAGTRIILVRIRTILLIVITRGVCRIAATDYNSRKNSIVL